jgi:hypothetical protein
MPKTKKPNYKFEEGVLALSNATDINEALKEWVNMTDVHKTDIHGWIKDKIRYTTRMGKNDNLTQEGGNGHQ